MQKRTRKGFTLIELLVTTAIIIGIGVIALVGLSGRKGSNDLLTTGAKITTLLRQAQSDSVAQEGGNQWGVYFSNATNTAPFYALYSSSTYSTSTTVAAYPLPPSVGYLASVIPSGSSTSVSFSQISGADATSQNIVLYLKNSPTTEYYIAIHPSGLVDNVPPDWVLVPGNGTYGTSNFFAMKYDAVCANASGTGLNVPADGNGYNNGGYTVNSNNCTAANGRQVASLPSVIPIVDVSHLQAVSYCSSIGAHLLTNDEFMTIANNIANQPANWTGGAVGSGSLYIGNVYNSSEYAADPNDANGYSNGSGGTMATTTALVAGDLRRTFYLSNGSVLWDMTGNLWQHVQRSVNNVGDAQNTMTLPGCTNGTAAWEVCQYGTSTTPYVSTYSSDVTALMINPSNSSWNSSQEMGWVYTYGSSTNLGDTIFIRGAFWGGYFDQGLFFLNLSWVATSTDTGLGFRCAMAVPTQ
jgi:type II secretory pathway pseudopilin PulG